MASSSSQYLLLFSISIAFFLGSNEAGFYKSYILPIGKDNATLQYYTTIEMGNPTRLIDVVIDLGGHFLWFNCDNGYKSSDYRPIPCGSNNCKVAKSTGCLNCNSSAQAPGRPGCTNNTCVLFAYNPINNSRVTGGLGVDTMGIDETDGIYYMNHDYVPQIPFACANAGPLFGAAAGYTVGAIGLARTKIALPSWLSFSLNISRIFALCIPSSSEVTDGDMFIGGGPYGMDPYGDAAKLLVRTPLMSNPVSVRGEYFIGVKYIKIDGKIVSFDTSLLSIDQKTGNGGTKLSTTTPYTVLHSDIYNALVRDFVTSIKTISNRVAAVAPFEACFSSGKIGSTLTGPSVPIIDLELEGNNSSTWRIYGANSMVRVNENVFCLGFINGGSKTTTSIVLGGHQMQDNLLEFDLTTSSLGFTSSLRLHNTTCSQDREFN